MLSEILPPKGKLAKKLECKNRIGSGNLFDVYAASEEGSEQRFVVKVLCREFECDQRILKKFEQEQMIASAVQHKNINKVLGFGALPEEYSLRPYIASEFIDGISLAEALRSWGECDSIVAASIASQICAALSAAHELGAVHGDLKPSNIYLIAEDKGTVKIVDFGVSQRLFCAEQTSRSNSQGGGLSLQSAMYMAPEVAKGAAVNPGADVYSVGCLLYHLFSGKAPFEGSSALDIAYQHAHDQPLDLPDTCATKDLRDAIAIAMQKEPESRLKTLADLSLILASWSNQVA